MTIKIQNDIIPGLPGIKLPLVPSNSAFFVEFIPVHEQ